MKTDMEKYEELWTLVNEKSVDLSRSEQYYCVSLWNYTVWEWVAISEWLVRTMGPEDNFDDNGRWAENGRKIWFRTEQDRTMFVLRWA